MPGLDQRGAALPPELALPSGHTVVVDHLRHSFVNARRYSLVFEWAGGGLQTAPIIFAQRCWAGGSSWKDEADAARSLRTSALATECASAA
jgi:hypothetical protein